MSKRFVGVFLPNLLLELAAEKAGTVQTQPVAVFVEDSNSDCLDPDEPTGISATGADGSQSIATCSRPNTDLSHEKRAAFTPGGLSAPGTSTDLGGHTSSVGVYLEAEGAASMDPVSEDRPNWLERAPLLRAAEAAVCAASSANLATGDFSLHCSPQSKVAAVNGCAQRAGARVGLTWVQALSRVPTLFMCSVTKGQLVRRLSCLAETLLDYGSPVSFQQPDTLWVDISGTGSLFGDECELAARVSARIAREGHVCAIAVASGALFSQAAARYLAKVECPVRIAEAQAAVFAARLPVRALPVAPKICEWFEKLGLKSLGQVRRLPERALVSRLEALDVRRYCSDGGLVRGSDSSGLKFATTIIDFLWGRDATELVPYNSAEELCVKLLWGSGTNSIEPILFGLKGLCVKFVDRAQALGKAVLSLRCDIFVDRAEVAEESLVQGQTLSFRFRLACAVSRADELERIISARLLRSVLPAPALGMALQAEKLTVATSDQLELARGVGIQSDEDQLRCLALLLAELQADIGRNSVGQLRLENSALWSAESGFSNSVECSRGRLGARTAGAHGKGLKVPSRSMEAVPSREKWRGRSHGKLSGPRCNNDLELGGSGRSISSASGASTSGELLLGGCGVSGKEANQVGVYEKCSSPLDAVPSRIWPGRVGLVGCDAPRVGLRLQLGHWRFTIKSLVFCRRDEDPEWWRGELLSRDYFRVWLEPGRGELFHSGGSSWKKMWSMEVLLCVDRARGAAFVCGSFD